MRYPPEDGGDHPVVPQRPRRDDGRRRTLVRAGMVAAAVLVAVVIVRTGAAPEPSAAPGTAYSTQAEAFALPALRGSGVVALAHYRGSAVVVNFFASWCTACRGELPGMVTVSHQLRGRVWFIGVDSRENGDGYAMAAHYGITGWPLARDVGGLQDSGLHDALLGQGMPITAFYDPRGKLLGVSYSALSESDLRGKLLRYYGITG